MDLLQSFLDLLDSYLLLDAVGLFQVSRLSGDVNTVECAGLWRRHLLYLGQGHDHQQT